MSVCLPGHPGVCLSAGTSWCLSVCQDILMSVCLPGHPGVCLSARTSWCLSVCQDILVSVCLPGHPGVCLSARTSWCLSVCQDFLVSVFMIYLSDTDAVCHPGLRCVGCLRVALADRVVCLGRRRAQAEDLQRPGGHVV